MAPMEVVSPFRGEPKNKVPASKLRFVQRSKRDQASRSLDADARRKPRRADADRSDGQDNTRPAIPGASLSILPTPSQCPRNPTAFDRFGVGPHSHFATLSANNRSFVFF